MSAPFKSIGILRLSAIGDVCHATATVQAIQRAYPDARITWIIGKTEAGLVDDLPGINFVVFDKSRGLRAIGEVRAQFSEPLDVLLHMQVAFRANLLAMAIPAREKLGFARHLSKELHGLAVSRRVNMPPRPHVLEGFQAFAEAIGVPPFAATWDIPIPDTARDWARQQLGGDRPVLAIAPCASKPERSWQPDGYAALVDHGYERGFEVVLTAGPSAWERDFTAEIVALCQTPVTNLAGRTNLKQLLALLAAAAVVIAPDTGPAHMAVTQGTPVIGLYAHSNPDRTGPYGFGAYTIDAYAAHIAEQTGRSSEQLPWGSRAKGQNLMQSISTQQVRGALDRVIADFELPVNPAS